MTLVPQPALYNPSFLKDDEFIATFVARQNELAVLYRRLKVTGREGDGQHQIVIGSRGMGKTSLLRRLAIEISKDPDLSKIFVPLAFREEQYNVLTLRDFWRNCGEALAEWAELHGKGDLAARLDAALRTEAWNSDEGAVERFLAETSALGKRPVLLVDNLDLIIDALKDKDRWSLRGTLQMRGGPIVIGAATHSLPESADRDAAFYEFFQPCHLDPLSLPETERCMRVIAKGRGKPGKQVVRTLRNDPARLKVLHRLTGGNPRVLALTYRFLESTETKDAMGDLERLLDEVTPYYKARIEEYRTPLQRATIDAIALHWDPVTTGDLSKITGVPSTTLSPQLIRLRKDGLIETTETSGAYSGHQMVERLLNIWYLMRHGTRRNRQRMRWLVAFLSSFYTSDDLARIDREAKASGLAEGWAGDYADAFEQARQRAASGLEEHLSSAILGGAEPGEKSLELAPFVRKAKAMLKKGVTLGLSDAAAAVIESCDAVVARFGDSDLPSLQEKVALAMFLKGLALGLSGDAAAAIETCDAVVARFGDSDLPPLQEHVAKAMYLKAITLDESGDTLAAISCYEQSLAAMRRLRVEGAILTASDIAIRLANHLCDLGIDQDRAEALYLEAVEHRPLPAYASLFWLYLSTERAAEAKEVLSKLAGLPATRRALIDAALALSAENFGEAMAHLETALSGGLAAGSIDFTDDLVRLVRIAIAKGFGERLIAWFDKTGFADRYAPVHVALQAAVRGERMLLDSNPEVRHAASQIHSRLTAGRGSASAAR